MKKEIPSDKNVLEQDAENIFQEHQSAPIQLVYAVVKMLVFSPLAFGMEQVKIVLGGAYNSWGRTDDKQGDDKLVH